MPEQRPRLCALYRSELAGEAAAGFPRLKRIPSTQVIRFLDYYAGLGRQGQDALLSAIAHFNSAALDPELYAAEAGQRQQHPVFGRFLAAMAFRTLTQGYRYTPMKLLAGLAKGAAATGGLAAWARSMGYSGLELQPPAELLPNLDCINPVKPARLRKLIDRALAGLFSPQKTTFGSELSRYSGTYGQTQLSVDVIFAPSSRLNPRQLQYMVKAMVPGGSEPESATFEGLWSLHSTWDYLTEENADRSVDLLAELVVYLTGLIGRVQVVTRPVDC
jgi:hypothetical protein